LRHTEFSIEDFRTCKQMSVETGTCMRTCTQMPVEMGTCTRLHSRDSCIDLEKHAVLSLTAKETLLGFSAVVLNISLSGPLSMLREP
jgi:hypothetical protein